MSARDGSIYECESCGGLEAAVSPFRDDAPEGVYLTIRRVTANHNHYVTDEIYTCSKECALDVVQYGIHHNASRTQPIGRD